MRKNLIVAIFSILAISVMLYIFGVPPGGLTVLYVISNITILFLYSQTFGRDFWVKLDENKIYTHNSNKKVTISCDMRDVRKITLYSHGFHLYFSEGNIRHVDISTETLENEKALLGIISSYRDNLLKRGNCLLAVYGNKSEDQISTEDNQ
ncbi:MAG: hypothetical protein JXR23_08915 [Pontiellaceae bacterium]|nr:hypothetical protein [Pontiellaceae bacterium]